MKLFSKLFLAVALLVGAGSAKAGDVYTGQFTLLTTMASISNATVTSAATVSNLVPANVPLVIEITAYGAAAGTSNLTVGFDLWDGSNNWTTVQPISTTSILTGTSTNTQWFYFAASNLYGAKAIRPGKVSTAQTNAVTVSAAYAFVYPFP